MKSKCWCEQIELQVKFRKEFHKLPIIDLQKLIKKIEKGNFNRHSQLDDRLMIRSIQKWIDFQLKFGEY